MKNDPLAAELYNKMQQEQNEYREWLLAQPPEEILNHAYEYSVREDITKTARIRCRTISSRRISDSAQTAMLTGTI